MSMRTSSLFQRSFCSAMFGASFNFAMVRIIPTASRALGSTNRSSSLVFEFPPDRLRSMIRRRFFDLSGLSFTMMASRDIVPCENSSITVFSSSRLRKPSFSSLSTSTFVSSTFSLTDA